MRPLKYDISLRVNHPEMDPKHICNALDMEAKRTWRSGERRQTPDGHPLEGVYDSMYCTFDLKKAKGYGLSYFLKHFNRKLYKHKEFFKSIISSGGKIEYFIGYFLDGDYGETLDLELLNQLSDLGIELAICYYCPREDKLLAKKAKKKGTKKSA